jgi:hypothetical protein
MIYMIGDPNGATQRLIRKHPEHFGALVTPTRTSRATGITALDNGAWAHRDDPDWWRTTGETQWLAARGAYDWLFVVMPDVVADADATLERYLRYRGEMDERGLPMALALQNGMTSKAIAHLCPAFLFLGGTTEWKLATLPLLAEFAHATNRWLHVGRVNTIRRLWLCASYGVHSCDGTGLARYPREVLKRLMPFFQQGRFALGGQP